MNRISPHIASAGTSALNLAGFRGVAQRFTFIWGIVLGFSVYFLLIAAATSALPSAFDETPFYLNGFRWPREGPPMWLSRFATWDAAHYLYLSEVGYTSGVRSCAFYPLWPLLIRAVARPLGANHVIIGLVLANLFAIGGFILFWQMVRTRLGMETAWWACAFLFVFPGSLFYHFVYSESLFFLLLMVLLWSLERQYYGSACAAAFLLPVTRAVGLFAVLPLAWSFLSYRISSGSKKASVAGAETLRKSLTSEAHLMEMSPKATTGKLAIMVVAPLAGYGVYLSLMWLWTGNPFEGFEAQKTWKAHSIGNLFDIPGLVAAYFTPRSWHAFRGSILDRCVFLLFASTVPLIWRLDKQWLVWALVLGWLPAMCWHFVSYTRFASVVFPLFIALAWLFFGPRQSKMQKVKGIDFRRWGGFAILNVFVVLHVILVWRFVNFRWAG